MAGRLRSESVDGGGGGGLGELRSIEHTPAN